jgi:hypothetical protein
MTDPRSLTPRLRDWRDVALESYFEESAQQQARIASLEETVGWLTEIHRAHLDVAHAQHVRILRLEASNRALRDELRLNHQHARDMALRGRTEAA